MLFHWTTTLLLLFCACARVKGQGDYNEDFVDEYKALINSNFWKIQPEANNSCYLNHSNKSPGYYVNCPTEVDCYVKPKLPFYEYNKIKPYAYHPSQNVCKPLVGQPLPSKKRSQLYGVVNIFGVSNESVCAFSSITSLTAFDNINNKTLKFGEANYKCPPYNLTKLVLGYLNIGHVSSTTFSQLRQLKQLVLHNCNISSIDKHAFANLVNLDGVFLSRNPITHLPVNLFRNTLQLKSLNLNMNKLSEFPDIGHPTNLSYLDLSNNRISSINTNDLNNGTRLSILDLSNNELSFIDEGTFSNAGHLTILDLDHNRLSKLPADFKTCNITELRLSYNEFTSFSFEIVPCFATKAKVSNNQIETIEALHFKDQKWNLELLDLSKNKIQSVEHLKLPRSIRVVDLSDNLISQASSLSFVNRFVDRLFWIDLRRNRIEHLCNHLFVFNYGIFMRIQCYVAGNPLRCSSELMWVKQQKDPIAFADLEESYCQSIGPNGNRSVRLSQLTEDNNLYQSDHSNSTRCQCPKWNLEGNFECNFPCPYNCSCLTDETFSAIYLICAHRQFSRVPRNLKLTSIRRYSKINVEFSGNSISHVGPVDFGQLNENVVKLLLPDCRIVSVDSNAFEQLTSLTGLNLANNQLKALPNGLFHHLTQLVTLDLSNNQLRHLADNVFVTLINLYELYLHNNNLNQLQLHQITRLTTLKNISLYGNPWSCDCTFIKPFQALLYNLTTTLRNKENINCYENGQKFDITNSNIEHCFKQVELIYLDQSTILISTLTCGLALIIIAGLVFKWRYELQVLVYSRYGLRMFHKRQSEEDAQSKQYDAFIAYNSDDEDLLVNELMPGLEGIPNPYRLCIHQRDFPAGSYIQNSILDAISLSSRTIVILSENFVQSGWCHYEFKSAHMQMLQDRCPRLLVIVVGQVPKTLDPEMKLYLTTNTYLKWGERLFWQKLYYAMPEQRVTTPPTDIMPMRNM